MLPLLPLCVAVVMSSKVFGMIGFFHEPIYVYMVCVLRLHVIRPLSQVRTIFHILDKTKSYNTMLRYHL